MKNACTRSGKSKADEGEQNSELIQVITPKFNELKQDLITEIKSLIQLEVEKVVMKQEEKFDETVLKLQERIQHWSSKKMTLSSMNVGYASELTMYLLNPRKQQIVFMKRLVNSSGKHDQIYLCLVLTEPTALGLNTSHTEIKRNAAAS